MIESLFQDAQGRIIACRESLSRGEIVDLAGVDEMVRVACERVFALPLEERAAHAERMQSLFAALSDLGQELLKSRDALMAELAHLTDHRKANTAYRTAEASDVRKPEENV